MIDKLITRVFEDRNAAHLAHWKTKSFAQHSALGDFYDDIIGSIDKLVECHQGLFGIVKTEGEADVLSRLKDEALWITQNRAKISRNIPALENLVDELSMNYLRAIYKLENLE